jgi:hypothetical protein
MVPTTAAQAASREVRIISTSRSKRWKETLSVARLKVMRYRVFHNEI